METYLLTQEDIDRLSELDFDMRGVAEGAEAMPSEMEMLRRPADLVAAGTPELLLPPPSAAAPAPVPMAAPAAQPAVEAGSVADTMSPEELASLRVDTNSEEARAAYNAAKPAAPVSGNMAMMQKLVELQTPAAASDDPFANLSKTQRRMLAFSALSDAGAALAGRQGNAFDSLMGRFNDLQDMNRKREAATLQQQMLMGLMGGGAPAGAGALAAGSVEALTAQKQKLMNFALMNPSVAPAIALQVKSIDDQIAAMKGSKSSLVTTNLGIAATEALLNSPNLDILTGFKGKVNDALNTLGVVPEYANLTSYIEQLRGLNFMEAFQSLKGGGPVTDTEGAKATAARSRMDAALSGNASDLRAAIQEVNDLFMEARRANPAYTGTTDSVTPTAPAAAGKTWNPTTRKFE